MKIRSAVPENGCLIFLWRTEKNAKRNICKTYTHPPHRRLRKTEVDNIPYHTQMGAKPPINFLGAKTTHCALGGDAWRMNEKN